VDYDYITPATISGTIDLGSYTGAKDKVGIVVKFLVLGESAKTAKIFLNTDGTFSIPLVDQQIYDVEFSGPTFLKAKLTRVDVRGDMNLGTITLVGGDINGDGAIDPIDLDALADVWGLVGQ
jgi:hypothetical protein